MDFDKDKAKKVVGVIVLVVLAAVILGSIGPSVFGG